MLACHYIKIFGVALSLKCFGQQMKTAQGVNSKIWFSLVRDMQTWMVYAVKRSFCHEITRWASGLVSVGARWETKDRFEWPFCWQIKCNLNAAGAERGESVNCCSTRHLFSRRAGAEAVIQITQKYKQRVLFVCNMSRAVQSGLEKGCKSGKHRVSPPLFDWVHYSQAGSLWDNFYMCVNFA